MAKKRASPNKPGGDPEVSDATTATKAKRAKAPKKRVITKPRQKTAPPRKRPGQKKRQAARKRKAKQEAKQTAATSPQAQQQQPPPSDSSGAGGYNAIIDPQAELRRSDMVLLQAAVKRQRQRVPVREDVLEAGASKVGRIMLGTTKERTALAAFRLMLTCVQINQADEHKGLPDKLEVSAAQPITVDDQRAAIKAAIAAEWRKRGKA